MAAQPLPVGDQMVRVSIFIVLDITTCLVLDLEPSY